MSREYANLERMRSDWFKQSLMNQLESGLGFIQISITIRIRILFGNLILTSYVLYVDDTHEIQFCLVQFESVFGFRSRSGSGYHLPIQH